MLVNIISLLSFLSLLISSVPAHSAVFNISSGDVTGLIAAINAANANGEENTINLGPGTYTLTAVDNDSDGPNGLPSVTSALSITGAGAETTIIERAADAPPLRLLHVAATGNLTLKAVTLQRGLTPVVRFTPVGRPFAVGGCGGGGIKNSGTVAIAKTILRRNRELVCVGGGLWNSGTATITDSIVEDNSALPDFGEFPPRGQAEGGGLWNSGTVTVDHSTFRRNIASVGGALSNGGTADSSSTFTPGGTVTLTNTAVEKNTGTDVGGLLAWGGGLANLGGVLTAINSTIASNRVVSSVGFGEGGGLYNARNSTVKLINSTVAYNDASDFAGGFLTPMTAARDRKAGLFELQNTLVALNTVTNFPAVAGASDCSPPLISLGDNFIGEPCFGVNLLPSDLTGDPGLGAFVDSGAPGTGRVPLLETSQAIDAGNDSACPPTDQLGTPRLGSCDIGAVEFYPVVNNLVVVSNISSAFDPEAVPGGPAGTLRITAEFTNTSAQTIGHRFAEVVELSGGNLLLNADRGAGGVGARLTVPDSASNPLLPGATETSELIIGLETSEPFTFLINMIGDPQISNSL